MAYSAKNMCRSTNKNLQEVITVTKENWTSKLIDNIYQVSDSPKDSWKTVKILNNWIKNYDGTFTTTDSEKIYKLKTHFHTVYNSKVIIDWDLLKEL